ncbi:D-alanine--D-alanine ligase family protein [Streptomyces sp. NPDC055056]
MTDHGPLRVLHLTGSPTSDFLASLSCLYAADCLESTADPSRYAPHLAHVTPDRRWRFPDALTDAALTAAPSFSPADAVRRIAGLGIDVALPQMFCLPGMTTYRSLLDLLRIPYVGNTPDVMALAAHKGRTRAIVAAAGVAVPPGQVLRPGEVPTLPPPVVVKPVDTDNSTGVTLARTEQEYANALRCAWTHAEEALVEAYIELGREVRCGIVVRDGELLCLPLEEYPMDSVHAPVRLPEDKIRASSEGRLRLAAKGDGRSWIVDPSDPVTARVWNAARRCHTALNCRDYSLFDFRIDPRGEVWFLEAGLYCSYARQSVIPTMARAAGIEDGELLRDAIDHVLSR